MSTLNLHNLKHKGKKKPKKRAGRGNASGAGNYSGRGIKGQRARSGGKAGLKRRGIKQMLKSKPKLGGFKSLKPKVVNVDLDQLEKYFEVNDLVNLKKLVSKQLIKNVKQSVKVIGGGKLTKKLTVNVNAFSNSAKEAIIKAGGKAEEIVRPKRRQGNKGSKKSGASGVK